MERKQEESNGEEKKSVDNTRKGKNQWLGSKGKMKNRKKKIKDVQKKLKDRSKTRQSIVFTGENCTFIDFASVRTLGAGCADGTKMVVKNKYVKHFPPISNNICSLQCYPILDFM